LGAGLEDVDAVDELLSDEAGDGDHGQAPIVELLHLDVLHVVGGLTIAEVERVPCIVAGDMVVLLKEQAGRLKRRLPSHLYVGGRKSRKKATRWQRFSMHCTGVAQ